MIVRGDATRMIALELVGHALVNALARSWEGVSYGEPSRNPARTEPRPPGIVTFLRLFPPGSVRPQSGGGGRGGRGTRSGMFAVGRDDCGSTSLGARASGRMRDGNGGGTLIVAVDAWFTPGSIGWAVERTLWAGEVGCTSGD